MLWAGMQQAKSLHAPMIQQGNKKLNEKRLHPCHKPILLYKKLFIDYGFKGMKVIDTHRGCGGIRQAAYEFGCSFAGCEIDKEYYDTQEISHKNFLKQQKLIFE